MPSRLSDAHGNAECLTNIAFKRAAAMWARLMAPTPIRPFTINDAR